MLKAAGILLVFQLAGEFLARVLGLPLPGPVLGMALLVLALLLSKRLPDWLESTSENLLRHLSLLFVPASVGLVQYLDRIGTEWLPIVVALVASTLLGITVSALAFVAVARLTGSHAAPDERKGAE
jgi:holin-like protein